MISLKTLKATSRGRAMKARRSMAVVQTSRARGRAPRKWRISLKRKGEEWRRRERERELASCRYQRSSSFEIGPKKVPLPDYNFSSQNL